MKIVALVQARLGSTRLPNKVLKPLGSGSLIEFLLRRLSRSTRIDQIVVASTVNPRDARLEQHVHSLGFDCMRGDESDVLARYFECARNCSADAIVRITGDCPLIDPFLVDEVIELFLANKVDYCSNTDPPTFPDGLDVEVFSRSALEMAAAEAHAQHDREHVTPYIRGHAKFSKANLANEIDLSLVRLTVDEPADLDLMTSIVNKLGNANEFGWRDVMDIIKKDPKISKLNEHIGRNEGASMGAGQKLWRRAKAIIPGGSMLLSKRAEMFLPEQWPAYFSRAKGCELWDLDGRKYTDMSFMGIGTNSLGYGHPEVDDAVRQVIEEGNMTTLNCPEEVYLAERLIELHPWADMARFARSGGEANAVAIRIARAASGKDKVAICGYHGWHDWYLSANLGDEKNLEGHLLPGLEPRGVPSELRGTVIPFNYNDLAALQKIVSSGEVGVIKMEVVRNKGPENDFLQRVRDLASSLGIVLIFDECTSGFRQTFGGLHKMYGVEPDMAIFGKALGNGYAITGVLGKKSVMQAAQTTFISSTFWTERIGPAAALKTLEVMEREQSWDVITNTGMRVTERWRALAQRHGLTIDTFGLPALTGFAFRGDKALAYKTLITQEMLGKGYLAGTSFYASTAHSAEIVDEYFEALDPVFGLIRQCEDGRDINALLKGPVCHAGFKRLN